MTQPSAPPSPLLPALVVMGVSGSGKTTIAQALAERLGLRFLDADDFHSAAAKAQMARGVPLTDSQREPWVDALGTALRGHAQACERCVLAFSGLRAAHRQRLRGCGVPLRFVFLHADADAIARRLGARAGHFMPASLLDSQFQALQLPTGEPDVLWVDADAGPAQVLERVLAGLADAAG